MIMSAFQILLHIYEYTIHIRMSVMLNELFVLSFMLIQFIYPLLSLSTFSTNMPHQNPTNTHPEAAFQASSPYEKSPGNLNLDKPNINTDNSDVYWYSDMGNDNIMEDAIRSNIQLDDQSTSSFNSHPNSPVNEPNHFNSYQSGSQNSNSDSSASIQIKTEQDAKDYLTSLLAEIKDLFDVRATNKILNSASKTAGLSSEIKEVVHQLQPINIAIYRERIAKFENISTSFRIDVPQVEDKNNVNQIFENRCMVHNKVQQFKHHTKWAAEVAEFSGFLKMHQLFVLGSNSANPKEFEKKMKQYLEKSGSQFSKYKAKCRRAEHVAQMLNPQTTVLSAYSLNIAALENANRQGWNGKDLRDFS